jgi:2-hydroxymuconate-semialdehyde hydrolase
MKKSLISICVIILFLVLIIIFFPFISNKEKYAYDEAVAKFAKGKIITIDNKKMHYLVKGQGKPVILIHGFLYSTVMWKKNIDDLSKKFKVYAIDLWGWGYSERLKEDSYSFDLYSKQVIRFMNELKIRKASLVGQSMGGGISVYTAAHYPERIDKLILIDPAVIPYAASLTSRIYTLPFVGEFLNALPGDSLMKNNIKDIWFYDKSKVTDEYAAEVIFPFNIKGSSAGAMYILRKVLEPPLVEAEAQILSRLNIPILIIHGREDRAVPLERSQTLNKMWSTSKLVIFEKAGHSPHEEYPDKFNRLALDFLSR